MWVQWIKKKKNIAVEGTHQCTVNSSVFLCALCWTAEDNEQSHG